MQKQSQVCFFFCLLSEHLVKCGSTTFICKNGLRLIILLLIVPWHHLLHCPTQEKETNRKESVF